MSKPLNTLQQDLFWLAKKNYTTGTLTRLEAAKVVCSYHALVPSDAISIRNVVGYLIDEFVLSETILKDRDDICRFLANTQDEHLVKGDYHEVLCERLFDRLYTRRTLAKGVWQMSFEQPVVDPFLQAIFNAESAIKDIRTLPPIST